MEEGADNDASEGRSGLGFHYSRARRLARASIAVQDMYKEKPVRRFGPFNFLFEHKGLGLLFATTLLFSGLFLFIPKFAGLRDYKSIGPLSLNLSAYNDNGRAVLEIHRRGAVPKGFEDELLSLDYELGERAGQAAILPKRTKEELVYLDLGPLTEAQALECLFKYGQHRLATLVPIQAAKEKVKP